MQRSLLIVLLLGLLAVGLNCGPGEKDAPRNGAEPTDIAPENDGYPPTAQVGVHQQFLDDLSMERHPSDGGGEVRLVLAEGEDGSVRAGDYGRWEFEYTAGALGIADGGSLFLLVPPFWGWSTPQSDHPRRPGFTTVQFGGEGLTLTPRTADRSLLQIAVSGRDLVEGESIRIIYGASEGLARADDYAESNSMFYFKVDGDGDGLSALVDSRPSIRVLPGAPARISANLTSTAGPGDRVHLTVAVLDVMASAGHEVEGTLTLTSEPAGLELPESVSLTAADRGRVRIPLLTGPPGTYRVRARLASTELQDETLSNPLRVGEDLAPVFWADLHGHSNYSDGTGTPRHFYEYARDVSALDIVVLTDHDHFGVRFMDATPEIWEEIQTEVERINEPGRFVALLGYEWTSWLYGHRHVVYFDGRGEVLSSVGAETTTPRELWDALRGQSALTFAHHSAGGPVATDWSFEPDEMMEPVTEIMSVHGSSEAADSPSRIYSAVRGNSVRDQLDRGFVFGFIGSGDGHDGHPGHAHLSPNSGYRRTRPDPRGQRASERMGNGGLAAVRATRLDEDSILHALRTRQVYATSGPRIWLDARLGEHPMGSLVPASEARGPLTLQVEIAGTADLHYVEIIRRGATTERIRLDERDPASSTGAMEARLDTEISGLESGDYLYLRMLQSDGALAWSSPFYIE